MIFIIAILLGWGAFELFRENQTDDWDKERSARSYVEGCVFLGGTQYVVSALYLWYQNIFVTIVMVTAIGACIAVHKSVAKKVFQKMAQDCANTHLNSMHFTGICSDVCRTGSLTRAPNFNVCILIKLEILTKIVKNISIFVKKLAISLKM